MISQLRMLNSIKRGSLFAIGALMIASTVTGLGFVSEHVSAAGLPWGYQSCTSANSWGSWGAGSNSARFHRGGFCKVNGANKIIFQGDGNLVVYRNGTAIWASNTGGRVGSGGSIAFQPDGNVVIINSSNRAIWNTGTHLGGGTSRMGVMQSDGNYVIYKYGTNQALWNTKGL